MFERRPSDRPHLRLTPPARQRLTIRFDGGRTRVVHSPSLEPPVVSDPLRLKRSPAPEHKSPLGVTDPRWVLAMRTQQLLHGDILPPVDREELIGMGKILGLTGFQANLIVAIVQDQARRGQTLRSGADLLAMVPVTAARPAGGRWRVAVCCAVALGVEALMLVVLCY